MQRLLMDVDPYYCPIKGSCELCRAHIWWSPYMCFSAFGMISRWGKFQHPEDFFFLLQKPWFDIELLNECTSWNCSGRITHFLLQHCNLGCQHPNPHLFHTVLFFFFLFPINNNALVGKTCLISVRSAKIFKSKIKEGKGKPSNFM